jgi:Ner family transcriptional regulator
MTAKISEPKIPTEPNERRAWVRLELARKGYTLASLAKRRRCSYSTLRQAMVIRKPKAEGIIARTIGIKPELIWPERYSKEAA